MTRFFVVIAAWSFALFSFCSPRGSAQVTFLPPTPYLSAADSPFDMSGLGTTFFLEDFEDGVFDRLPGMTTSGFLVNGSGPLTDSVDADDGVIDGFGTAGHSLMFQGLIVNTTIPPVFNTGIDIVFDEQQLGFSPNVFGFVWTDGMPTSVIGITVRDGNNVAFPLGTFPQLMDDSYLGETMEDRFFGIHSESGIRRISIDNVIQTWDFVNQFEMDHVQFGFVVPEPRLGGFEIISSWIMLIACLSARVRKLKGVIPHVTCPPPLS
jgi:hypothetical protein